MRLEVTIPDNTRPDLVERIVAITQRLSQQPEFADEISLSEDEEVQRLFTPERLQHIRQSAAEMERGEGVTLEQAEQRLAKVRADWIANHSK